MTKAAVEYVKVCSEFGDGFYYIPGSDTCLSINGYVRADYYWYDPESRADDGTKFFGSAKVNFDARTATEYGTLRSLISLKYSGGDSYSGNDSRSKAGIYADKAFIQFGGLTAGLATSFYDYYDSEAGNTIRGSYFSSAKTTHLLAYTAAFGSGLAATISLEDNYLRREGTFTDTNSSTAYGGQRAPDVVASLRWTQGWGSAQIMAAAHETRSDLVNNFDDHSKWGYAIGAGVIVNLPSGFSFALEGNYGRGAMSYVGLYDGNPFNDVLDADIFPINATSSSMELSDAWSVTGEIGYQFTPSLVGHIVASYASYDAPFGVVIGNNPGVIASTDFDTWAVSANLAYTITKGLTLTGEVLYENRDYKNLSYINLAGFPAIAEGPDYDTWAVGMRLRRDF